jgi:hypothetical protein
MRPRGDPAALVAGARLLAGAAAELERVGRGLEDLGQRLSAGGAWSGRASGAARERVALVDAEVGHGAEALRQAAHGASRLAGELAAAQAAWDRAASLAGSAGLVLDPGDPAGLLPAPPPWGDPRVPVAARAAEIARGAAEQARLADRSAAARFTEAAATAARVASPDGAPLAGGGAALAGAGAAGAGAAGAAPPPTGSGGPGSSRERERPSLLGRGLAVADRIGVAVGAGLEAVEARARALGRLVSTGTEPAAGLAAARALATFERPALADTLMAFLPVGGPVITLAANLVEGQDRGEPLVRAVVRSLGASIGADAGQRIGIAVCGAGAAATDGVGGVLCPAIAVASTSVGASLGGTEAVRIFDALGPDLEPRPDPPSTAAPPPTDPPSTAAAPPTGPPSAPTAPRTGPPPTSAAGRRP